MGTLSSLFLLIIPIALLVVVVAVVVVWLLVSRSARQRRGDYGGGVSQYQRTPGFVMPPVTPVPPGSPGVPGYGQQYAQSSDYTQAPNFASTPDFGQTADFTRAFGFEPVPPFAQQVPSSPGEPAAADSGNGFPPAVAGNAPQVDYSQTADYSRVADYSQHPNYSPQPIGVPQADDDQLEGEGQAPDFAQPPFEPVTAVPPPPAAPAASAPQGSPASQEPSESPFAPTAIISPAAPVPPVPVAPAVVPPAPASVPVVPAVPADNPNGVGNGATDEGDVGLTRLLTHSSGWLLETARGQIEPLPEGKIVLGRRPVVPATLAGAKSMKIDDPDRTVSGTHCVLELVDGQWLITDLGSSNGVILVAGQVETEVAPNTPTPVTGDFFLGDLGVRIVPDPATGRLGFGSESE